MFFSTAIPVTDENKTSDITIQIQENINVTSIIVDSPSNTVSEMKDDLDVIFEAKAKELKTESTTVPHTGLIVGVVLGAIAGLALGFLVSCDTAIQYLASRGDAISRNRMSNH